MMGCVFYLYIEKKLASCYAVDIEQQEASAMAKFNSLIPDVEIENAAEDFKNALKIEQYRLGRKALYFPAGLRWAYLPLSAIESAEEAHRVVSAGKCVSVEVKRPTLRLTTGVGEFSLNLEKPESLQKMLKLLRPEN